MAIRIKDAKVMDDDGSIVNTPVLTVNNPSSPETLVEVNAKLTTFGGEVTGYASGGIQYTPSPSSMSPSIQKFPFSISAGVATIHGNLSADRRNYQGISSPTDGFCVAGSTSTGIPGTGTIDKFSFTSEADATDIGDIAPTTPVTRSGMSAHRNNENGFVAGGSIYTTKYSDIYKFPFSISQGYAVDVGSLLFLRGFGTGHSSDTHGFNGGGFNDPSPFASPSAGDNSIMKFPFAINGGTATDVGNWGPPTTPVYYTAGFQNTTHGFYYGGTPGFYVGIHRFPFAIESGQAADVGDISYPSGAYGSAGISAVNDGFAAGQQVGPSNSLTTIDKYPFALASSATDVGDLASHKVQSGGHEF